MSDFDPTVFFTEPLWLWVDDVRPVPDERWTLATSSAAAQEILHWYSWNRTAVEALGGESFLPIEKISLDGDLGIIDGVEDSGEFVLDYMILRELWPQTLTIHTSNRAKRDRMVAAAKSIGANAPEGMAIQVRYW